MKKKILLFALAASVTTLATAQLEKGNIMFGTAIELGLSPTSAISGPANSAGIAVVTPKDDKDSRTTLIHFSPKAGYLIDNGTLFGVNFSFFYEKAKEADDPITVLQAGPFLRYYILGLGKACPFVHGGVQFGTLNAGKNSITNETIGSNLFEYNLGLGFALIISEQVSLDVMAAYESITVTAKNDKDEKDTINSIGLNVGFSIFL